MSWYLHGFSAVFTTPGLMVRNTKPSSRNSAAYLVTAWFNAALEMQYAVFAVKLVASVTSGMEMGVESVITFLAVPWRRSGRKASTAWMAPRVFTLNYMDERAG